MLIIIIIISGAWPRELRAQGKPGKPEKQRYGKNQLLRRSQKKIWDYLGIFPNEFLPEIHQSLRVRFFKCPAYILGGKPSPM